MMDRQCRICFESDERTPFLTPCECRGTQAYIHTHCLALYRWHFPNNVCRVCGNRMSLVQNEAKLDFLGLIGWLLALMSAEWLPMDSRRVYLVLVCGGIAYSLRVRGRPLRFAMLGMGISGACLVIPPPALGWVLAGMIGLVTGMVLWIYIPTAYLLVGVAILTSAFYSAFLLVYMLTRTNPTLASLLVCLLGTIWYGVIRARPSLRNL